MMRGQLSLLRAAEIIGEENDDCLSNARSVLHRASGLVRLACTWCFSRTTAKPGACVPAAHPRRRLGDVAGFKRVFDMLDPGT